MDTSPLTVITVGGLLTCAFAGVTALLVRREERRGVAPARPDPPAPQPAPRVEAMPDPRIEAAPEPTPQSQPEPEPEPAPAPSLVLSLDAYTKSGA